MKLGILRWEFWWVWFDLGLFCVIEWWVGGDFGGFGCNRWWVCLVLVVGRCWFGVLGEGLVIKVWVFVGKSLVSMLGR